MAKRKRSTSAEDPPAPIPTADIPRDPETLRKIGDVTLHALGEYERDVAAQAAKRVIAEAAKRPKRRTTRRDIEAINGRLRDVAHTLAAIHSMSLLAIDYELRERQDLLLLIRESARSSARAVDVCMQRLGDDPVGYFADDLHSD